MADDNANLRVTIVDTDTFTRDLIGGVPTDLGIARWNFVSISEGAAALKSLRHKEIDIVIYARDTVERRLRTIREHFRSLTKIATDAGSDLGRMTHPPIAWDRRARSRRLLGNRFTILGGCKSLVHKLSTRIDVNLYRYIC